MELLEFELYWTLTGRDPEGRQRLVNEHPEFAAQCQARDDAFRLSLQNRKPLPPPKPRIHDFPMDGKKVGDIIENGGKKYRVTHDSYHLTAKESNDLEDGWDTFVDPGWHTETVLIEGENV